MSDRPDKPVSDEALRALIGPADPELSCEQCFEQLDRYVEAELEGRDAERAAPGMGAHLVGCPACGEDHAALRDYVAERRSQPQE